MRWSFLITVIAGLSFCASANAEPPKAAPAEHAHAEHGPRGGDLIELGNEEFHVEVVHNEKAGIVSFYLLDSTAKKAQATVAKEVLINVKQAGKGVQYKIAPAPQQNDPQGSFTCYATKDKQLIETLEKHGVEAFLVVEIGGKQYRGKIDHHHDHAPEKK